MDGVTISQLASYFQACGFPVVFVNSMIFSMIAVLAMYCYIVPSC